MAKKMERYLAVIDPIRKRFGCNTREAGDRISQLLGFEQTNHRLTSENLALKEDIKKLEQGVDTLKEGFQTEKALLEQNLKSVLEGTEGMKDGFTLRLQDIKAKLLAKYVTVEGFNETLSEIMM